MPDYPLPGFSATRENTPTEFVAEPRQDGHNYMGIMVDSGARDAGNTPTTTLRAGLVMGKVSATGRHKQYDPSASDGTETAAGILMDQTKVVDAAGDASHNTSNLFVHGRVKEDNLHGLDSGAKADLAGQIIFV